VIVALGSMGRHDSMGWRPWPTTFIYLFANFACCCLDSIASIDQT